MGGPVCRNGLDGLQVFEAGIGSVVLQDRQLAGEFTEDVDVLTVRMEDQVTGTEAGFELKAGNGGQLAFIANVVNDDQVHPQVTDDQPLVRRQVGVVNVGSFLFRFRSGLALVGYHVGPGQLAIGCQLEDLDVSRVVVGTVEQVTRFVQADVCRSRALFHEGAQRFGLAIGKGVNSHPGLVAILLNCVDPLVRADLQVGWLLGWNG